jgi:hypothetical protein
VRAILTTFLDPAARSRRLNKETEALMTATFFWKLISQTGSIDAYLAYRQIPPATTSG